MSEHYRNERHRDLCWAYWQRLEIEGRRAAMEAGLPGGRVDIVEVDEHKRWIHIFEVKHRRPAEEGIEQLLRYSDLAEGEPALTLIVTPNLVTEALRNLTDAEGIHLEAFDGSFQLPLFDDFRGPSVHLPFVHPITAARISRLNRQHAEERRRLSEQRGQVAA